MNGGENSDLGQPVGPAAPRAGGLGRALDLGLPLLLALLAVGGALTSADEVIGDGVDLYGTLWFYGWIEACLGAARDPGFTDWMFHPLGKNILAHTGNNFVDAILAAPWVRAFGLARGQAIAIALILWGNALSMRPLLARLSPGGWPRRALLLLWTINPFAMTELVAGRPTQAMLWGYPLAALALLRCGEGAGPIGRWRWPALLGLAVALQGWTYWFSGAFLGAGLLALGALQGWRPAGRPRFWLAAGAGAALCGLLIAPGVAAVVGAGGGLGPAGDGVALLQNNVGDGLHGISLTERQGLPVLLRAGLLMPLALGLAGGRRALPWLVLAALGLGIAVGPTLSLPGFAPIPMPHYRALIAHLPFWDRLWFPYRAVSLTVFSLTVGAAVGLRSASEKRPVAAVGLAGLALLVGLLDANAWLSLPLHHRPMRAPPVLMALTARPGGLIELPIGLARESIAHQAWHRLPTFGGMGENAPFFWPKGHKQRLNNPLLRFLRAPTAASARAEWSPAHLQRVRSWGMRYVVLDRQTLLAELAHPLGGAAPPVPAEAEGLAALTAPTVAAISAALGPPVGVGGAHLVWDLACVAPLADDLAPCAPLAAPFSPTLAAGSGWAWARAPARTEWEALLIDRGRAPTDPDEAP